MTLRCPRFATVARLQAAASNAPPIKSPERSDGVRRLQEALADLGAALPGSVKGDDFDGIFGAETTKAVQDFQKREKLSVDGIAGKETLGRMDALFLKNDWRYGDPVPEAFQIAQAVKATGGRAPLTHTLAGRA